MRKLLISLLIALTAFGTSLSQIQIAHAAEEEFVFTTSSNGATVTGYSGTDLNVVIPATLSGVAVTSIGRSAFDTNGTVKPKITGVVIPNSVKEIQTYAFRYNSLTSIDLPDNLLTIGSSAFENNPLTNVVFPDSVTMIGNYAFYMNGLTSITLSENLKTIAGGAFDTNNLTRLVIPAGVTNVQSSAFYANKLTSVTVLGAGTSFGTGVFTSNPGNLKLFGVANSPAAAYAANNGHTFVDGTALFQAVATAKASLINHLPGTGVGQVPANTHSNLTSAYNAATAYIYGIGNATVASDLVTAAVPLTAAISAFEGQIIPAGNPAALGSALTEAGQALTEHKAGTNAGQTSVGDRSALQTAIDMARQIYNQAGNYRQDELDVAAAELDAAMDTFRAAIIPAGDPTALGNTLANAQQAMTDHPQGTNVGQTSSGTLIALQTAINMAQQILQNASQYSQSQLDAAVSSLSSAIQAFEAAIIGPGNPTALGAAITVAEQAMADHPQGTGVGQTSTGDRSALRAAINAAQVIVDDALNQTQAQLDAATSVLNAAITAFQQAIVPVGDSSMLNMRLTNAGQALTNHPEGTDVGQASASDRSTLQAAIDAAQAIADDALNQTQGQLDAAVADLETAMATFEAVIIPAGDATDLEDLLVNVTQTLADHPEGTGVGQATASDRSTLQAAINAAQAIVDDALNQTQDQLNNAVANLKAAMAMFEAAIIPAGDATNLEDLLVNATQTLANHLEGTGVGQASANERSALQAAINAAQAIADDALNQTQGQLDAAVSSLSLAIQAFNVAIIGPGNPTALGAAIIVAEQAMADHPQGTGVGQTSTGDRDALGTALDTARQIRDNAGNYTESQLDAAVADLERAMATFEAAIIPAGDATDLEGLLVNVTQTLADHSEGTGVGQATASDRSALQAAINAAQAIADDALNQTQGQLDAAVADLATAMGTFEAVIIPAGDATELEDLLVDAARTLANHPEGTGVGQASASDRSALQAAINAAQAIADDALNQTQGQLDAAVTDLATAMGTFEAVIIPAGDATELEDLLVDAARTLANHPEGTGVGQASASDRSALQAAINAAQAIADDALNQTQGQLDAAVTDLETAMDTFEAVIIPAGDATELGDWLVDSAQTLANHLEGTGVGQASANERSALQAAINAAQAIADDALNQTQGQLDAAVSSLSLAIQAFNVAIIGPGNPTALGAAIIVAEQVMADHPQGTGVGETSTGDRGALGTALDKARQIRDNASDYTQNQLDAAVADLETAMATFEAAIIPAGDATDLKDLLVNVTQTLANHPEGTGVGQASASDRSALQAAINAAQAIADDALKQTQDQLDAVVSSLSLAIQAFNVAIIGPGNPKALGAAIIVAEQVMAEHPQGTGVGQTSTGDRGALGTALDKAWKIRDNASDYTQNQLDAAVADLATAMATFEAAIIPAGNATDLEDWLVDAAQTLADHPEGAGVGQASANDRSVLQAAINAAEAIADDAPNQTQDQLDAAVADLETAMATFEAGIIPAGNATDLEDWLVDAAQTLANHPEGSGVGQASAIDRSALQAAINAAQAIANDALNQTQDQLDAAIANLETAKATFEAAWVGLVLTAPANKLYGPNNILHFTVRYGYEVIVAGMPVIPLKIGASSDTRTVYAAYTGARNESLTVLTFEYKVPSGITDADGIEVAAALELPDGASIVRASGGAASLAYGTPDTSGIYIVAMPPVVTLTAEPDGSTRQVIRAAARVYGESAGNTLTVLRWLKGNLNAADFTDGTGGTDILSEPRFTVSENGDYTVFARDEAGNDAVKVFTVSGISTPSPSVGGDRPASNSNLTINPDGGITALVSSSDIEQVTRPDGTVIEQVILSERMRERVLELLREAKEPIITIEINDREHAVQTRLPAAWITEMAKGYPNAIIEVKLNGSSYQLRISAIDLPGLAERLDAEASDLTVSIIQEQAGEDIRHEIERIGVSQGFTVFGGVIDYKVTVESNGQTMEVQDFGGTYMVRTIKLDGEVASRNLVAVQYDPATRKVVFVPARLGTRPDGSTEAILNVPHNSLYTVVDVKARTFADLTGHWAKADVDYLASKLLVNGATADLFVPDGTITRAEFLALLVRGLGLSVKEGEDSSHYADVLASAWYSPAVNAAVANRLATGISADRFAPNDPITREQMAVIIGRALTFTGHVTGDDGRADSPLTAFTDRDSISSWAQSAVALVSEAGIIKGMEDGRFGPTEYATRAQAAVMLKRLLQYLQNID
ncbi:S-layer homology domain-containing protein [Paenibacillus paridis]|uniref:S-layer homology domain-containing protein n=1 Tax=Paenibacillus paridis TaxID=2583376 RepID=UPI0011246ADA|nr:S-layer homology domain-containing protein [Paenibacillus paridis]